MNFNYQFEVSFIYKDKNWSKHLGCRTFANDPYNYLAGLIGLVLSNYSNIIEVNNHIDNILLNKKNELDGYILTDLGGIGGILISNEKARVLDFIHTPDGIIDGIQGPINYNINTPEEDQVIEKTVLLDLMKEWRDFLILEESMEFVKKKT